MILSNLIILCFCVMIACLEVLLLIAMWRGHLLPGVAFLSMNGIFLLYLYGLLDGKNENE